MKLASLKAGRDGRLVVVARDLTRAVARTGSPHAAARPWSAGPRWSPRCATGLAVGAGPADGAFPSTRGLRLALATRLSMGRRLGLRHPCRAGQEGPRCGAARAVLDRSAHVPGRLGQLRRPARPDLGHQRGLGHRPRGRGRGDHRRRAHGHARRPGRPAHQAGPPGQRRHRARPDPRRARQGLRLPARQARQRLLAGGRDPGRAGDAWRDTSCICRCSRSSTASRSASPTPAPT